MVVRDRLFIVNEKVYRCLTFSSLVGGRVTISVFGSNAVPNHVQGQRIRDQFYSIEWVEIVSARGFRTRFVRDFIRHHGVVRSVLYPSTRSRRQAAVVQAVVEKFNRRGRIHRRTFLVRAIAGSSVVSNDRSAPVFKDPHRHVIHGPSPFLRSPERGMGVQLQVLFPVRHPPYRSRVVQSRVSHAHADFILLYGGRRTWDCR